MAGLGRGGSGTVGAAVGAALDRDGIAGIEIDELVRGGHVSKVALDRTGEHSFSCCLLVDGNGAE